jgi:hypothetical protein
MTRLNTSEQYIYSPAAEAKAARKQTCIDALYVVATIVVFAFIGVLLAWRG